MKNPSHYNNLNDILTSHTDRDFHNTNDIYETYLDIKPNFKYYEVHDFHKLMETNQKKHKHFSYQHMFPSSQF